MNILITGAFGFVGTNLSKAFKTALTCRLIALDLKEPEKHDYDKFFTWHELDKITPGSADTIIHLAGNTD